MEILIRQSPEEGAELAARIVCAQVRTKPNSVLGLATGSTPLLLYRELRRAYAGGGISFRSCTTFNLDEYVGLDPDDPSSYAHTMEENLFRHIDVEPANTHLPDGRAEDLHEECRRYEELIDESGGIDLQVLGIGANGHIGFNEPTCSLASRTWLKILSERTVTDNARFFDGDVDRVPAYALTMGIETILSARHCLLLAWGREKADAVRDMIEGPVRALCPASALQMHPRTTVVLDEAAAGRLRMRDHYRWVEQRKLDWQRY